MINDARRLSNNMLTREVRLLYDVLLTTKAKIVSLAQSAFY